MSDCEVCQQYISVGVGAMPGVPMSFAYCKGCLEANAHPYWAVVANTVCIGGLDNAAEWWQELVHDTLRHLGRTEESFKLDVDAELEEERCYLNSVDNT